MKFHITFFNNLTHIINNINFRQYNLILSTSFYTTHVKNHDSTLNQGHNSTFTYKTDKNESLKLIEYEFRWGIGSKFRENSKNRIKPTHKEKPITVSIPSDYFDINHKFENCKIVFDKLNEQWEVLWIEYNKLNGKPFPVKKHGIHISKLKSIEFAISINDKIRNEFEQKELDNTSIHIVDTDKEKLEKKLDEDNNSQKNNVIFDHILQCWVGLGRVNNRPIARAYSADYHGYENSKKLSKKLTNNTTKL